MIALIITIVFAVVVALWFAGIRPGDFLWIITGPHGEGLIFWPTFIAIVVGFYFLLRWLVKMYTVG